MNERVTAVEARKTIKNHKGLITTAVAGPLEWEVIITKKEAVRLIKVADLNKVHIILLGTDDSMGIMLQEAYTTWDGEEL